MGIFSKALEKAKEKIKILESTLRKNDDEVGNLKNEVEKLKREVDILKKENNKLRQELLGIKPCSKEVNDSFSKKKRNKKRGPKRGHPCNPRKTPEKVDRTITLVPKVCACGHELPDPCQWHEHYQVDLPEPQPLIATKFLVGWSFCKCCNKKVSASNKLDYCYYGPRLHAQLGYWKYGMGLSYLKIKVLLKEQYNIDISTGQLSEMIKQSGKKMNCLYQTKLSDLSAQRYIHADESGWRVEGKNAWLWSFSNKDMSVYVIDESRSQRVVEEVLGTKFNGILISDFYGAYNKIECRKQKCWFHVLKDLKELNEKYPKCMEIKNYYFQAQRFFDRSTNLQLEYELGIEIGNRLERLKTNFQDWILKKYKSKDLMRMCKRLIKYRSEMFTFIKSGVEATNNPGEREIKPAVLMRKISNGNNSKQGAQNQAIWMTEIQTCKKQNIPVVEMVTQFLTLR